MKQIVWLACEYGRYGYRRITALLHWEGWRVNHKRVERIWREEGLKVPKKQPKRKRLWLQRVRAFGYVRIVAICMELSPSGRLYLRWKAYSNADSSWTSLLGSAWRSTLPRGSPARMCSSGSSDLFVHRGVPDHIRSDSRESSRPRASVNG